MRSIITQKKDLEKMVQAHKGQGFAFDVETSGLDYLKDELLGIAFYFEDTSAYYVTLSHTMGEGRLGYHRQHFLAPKEVAHVVLPLFDQEVVQVAHNAKFDLHFLERNNITPKGRLADTLLAAQLLDENRENNLKSLAVNILGMEHARYSTMLYYQGFKAEEILGAKLEDVAEYAMKDVEATWRLWPIFHEKLAEEEWRGVRHLDIFNNIWMPLMLTLQQMESRGIAIDMDLVHEIRKEYVEIEAKNAALVHKEGIDMVSKRWEPKDIPALYLRMATAEELEEVYLDPDDHPVIDDKETGIQLPLITHDMVGKTKAWRPRVPVFSHSSSTQRADYLYNYIRIQDTLPEKVELKKSPKTQNLSADKDNLETLVFYCGGDEAPPFLQASLEWSRASKFITTYLDVFIRKGDPYDSNAIHTWFAMAVGDDGKGGTATGRLSSSGPNLQNIPSRGDAGKRARQMFIARENYLLGVADLSQAELRMLAHYSKDQALMKAFEEEQDLHIVTGAGLARMSYEDLFEMVQNEDPEGKKLRALGKTANFGLTYGMGAVKFQRFILVNNKYEVSIEEAQEMITLYNQTYAGASHWKMKQVIPAARALGYVATLYGRKRRLPDIYSKNKKVSSYAERQGINAIIQGSVGDVMCEAMTRIQPALRELGGTILLQVHDELVCEIPSNKTDQAQEIIEEMMVSKCNPMLRLPQKADCGFGRAWGEAKG